MTMNQTFYDILEAKFAAMESLSPAIRSGFDEMRELDARTEELRSEIRRLNAKSKEPGNNSSSYLNIFTKKYSEILSIAHEKVRLSEELSALCNAVRDHLENRKFRYRLMMEAEYPGLAATIEKKYFELHSDQSSISDLAAGPSDERKIRNEGVGSQCRSQQKEVSKGRRLYCFCQKEAYGKMIACEAINCPYEWFHFECLNLQRTPQGRFICPSCKKVPQRTIATASKRLRRTSDRKSPAF